VAHLRHQGRENPRVRDLRAAKSPRSAGSQGRPNKEEYQLQDGVRDENEEPVIRGHH
jgi:hypothetical protein